MGQAHRLSRCGAWLLRHRAGGSSNRWAGRQEVEFGGGVAHGTPRPTSTPPPASPDKGSDKGEDREGAVKHCAVGTGLGGPKHKCEKGASVLWSGLTGQREGCFDPTSFKKHPPPPTGPFLVSCIQVPPPPCPKQGSGGGECLPTSAVQTFKCVLGGGVGVRSEGLEEGGALGEPAWGRGAGVKPPPCM